MKVKKHLSILLITLVATVATTYGSVPVKVQTATSVTGVVVSGHPEATQIGVEILEEGGNAIDASIAVSLALGVAEPYGSGVGGKLMLLYYEAETGKTWVIDAMDAAPHSLDVAKARNLSWQQRRFGWNSVCIPGLPAGLDLAYQQWASKPWKSLVLPSIKLAREGFRIEPKTFTFFKERLDRIQNSRELASIYLPNGAIPEVGSRLKCPDLANTLEIISREGIRSVYEGTIAKALSTEAQANGAPFSLEDLRHYQARLTTPVCMDLAGYQIQTSPPPTTGAAMAFPVMKLLESLLDTSKPQRSLENLSIIANVWKQVKPRIYETIGDRSDARQAFEALLSDEFLDPIRDSLSTDLPQGITPELEDRDGSTTHFVVVDRMGNMVSCTQSLSLHFGSGIVVPGTGIILNDTMSNFDFVHPENPNVVGADKRPRSTISPTIIFENDKPKIVIGLPGGSRIPTAMLQVILDRLIWNRPLDQAIGDIRYHVDPATRSTDHDTLESESGISDEIKTFLPTVGWEYFDYEPAGTGLHFGGFTAIEVGEDGSFIGYADLRRTNVAKGAKKNEN